MDKAFVRWAILTALKLLYIIAVGNRPQHFNINFIRREIEVQGGD